MKLAAFSLLTSSTIAFIPINSYTSTIPLSISETSTSIAKEQGELVETATSVAEEKEKLVQPAVAPINGWVPDASLPCYGLPGAIAPLGFFDPLGFTKDMELGEVKRYREAEIMHGRVAMMATVGYIIGESTPTITYGMDIHHTIANNQLAEISLALTMPLFLAINFAE